MANMLFANNANTTLASSLTNVATTMSVTSASAFPSPTGSQYFYCTLADAATQTTIEIVKVTAVSGTTFTITRGQDGTSGTAFATGDVVSLRLVRASLNDFPKLDENNTFSYAPTFNTALGVASGGTGVTSATGTGAGASVVLSQAPAINSPVITSYSTSTVPLKVCGLSGQITELFDVYTYNGGTLAFQINSSGAIATGTWNASVIGAAYGGTGEAGTLTGILYGNGTSAHTVATTAQLLNGIGTLPVANGGTGLTSLTSGYVPYGNGTGAFSSSSNFQFNGTNSLAVGGSFPNTVTNGIAVNNSSGTYPGYEIQIGGVTQFYINATNGASYIASTGTNPMAFYTNGSERMRLDSSGNLNIGQTSAVGKVNIFYTGTYGIFMNGPSGGSYPMVFQANGTGVGSIQTNGTITTYNTVSDYRLKQNVAPMTGALDKVAKLKPVTYSWKSNGLNGQGFIAHEIQEVVPDCVIGEKDAVDEKGNPIYQGMDTSFLVATLTAAIQELSTKFDAYVASHP